MTKKGLTHEREFDPNQDCWSCKGRLGDAPLTITLGTYKRRCANVDNHVCGKRHEGVTRCELSRAECKSQQERDRRDQWKRDPSRVALRADEVYNGLLRHLRPPGRMSQWAVFGEFAPSIKIDRRIDLYAVNTWPSRGLQLRSYEIKVSRSDFLHEMAHPEKRQPALAISTEWYVATPEGLVGKNEVPEEAGLVWVRYGVRGASYVQTIVPAPRLDPHELTWDVFAALARRVHER